MTGTFKRFTPDEKDFIKEYAPGHSRAEITEALNKRFDANRSITSVDNYIQRNKINVIMNIYKLPRNSKEQTIASIQTAALIAGIIDAKERVKEKNHDT